MYEIYIFLSLSQRSYILFLDPLNWNSSVENYLCNKFSIDQQVLFIAWEPENIFNEICMDKLKEDCQILVFW